VKLGDATTSFKKQKNYSTGKRKVKVTLGLLARLNGRYTPPERARLGGPADDGVDRRPDIGYNSEQLLDPVAEE